MKKTTFSDLALIEPIATALRQAKYESPTPIQAKTVPPALDGRDILGCAQTGTGKTAAFALPLLNALGKQSQKAVPNCPLALVLAPTRELAGQIEKSFAKYGKNLRLRTTLVYGGVGQGNQVRSLRRGTHILVATPGRLLDLIGQGHIDLSKLKLFVLDEADRMLDMGFLPAIRQLIKVLPSRRQSLFFSATLAPNIVKLAERLLRDPVSVNVTPKKTSVRKIEQRLIHIESRGKRDLLKKLLKEKNVDRALVFTRTKRGANLVARVLREGNIASAAIHGNKSQSARERALTQLRAGKIQVLVATDVASRGIDIKGITHVVNFDLPREPEAYVHRIGRTGRAGAEGVAISFCTPEENKELRAIERLVGHKLPAENVELPTRKQNSTKTQNSEKASRQRKTRTEKGKGRKQETAQVASEPSKPKSKRRRRRRRSTEKRSPATGTK